VAQALWLDGTSKPQHPSERQGKFDDLQLSTFLAHLPAHLQILRALARN